MKHTEKFLKQRKFMMMLPVLVLPFLTLIFWALGGGKGSAVQAMPIPEGLNEQLPDAQFEAEREEDLWDKFTLYEKAAHDSAAYETARENDPYFDLIAFESKQEKPKDDQSKLIGTFKRKDRLIDPNEAKVNSKLQQLYQEINRASDPGVSVDMPSKSIDQNSSTDIAELETMMEDLRTQQHDVEEEDDMAGINTMLEKLMDVQHPERVRERMNATKSSGKPKTFEVHAARKQIFSSLAEPEPKVRVDSSFEVVPVNNGFFDLDDSAVETTMQTNTIQAVIHETQELVTGATVRLRLLQDVTINNILIPKDQFVFGSCTINGERVMVEVTSILSGQTLVPVSLSVFDLTGLEGIYVRGAMSRDAAKQASDDALQNVQLMSMDQSLGAQAATAGIEATKTLLSKKVKLIKVIVKAGHQVVLRNKSQE